MNRIDGLIGSRLVGDASIALERVHTDTRSLRAGDFFVALRGERFDAHDFLPQAKVGGAVAALAERGLEQAGLAGLEVADSGAALLALGGAWRAQHTLPLIAVTGSNGKTTVTQMIAAILRVHHPSKRFLAIALGGSGNIGYLRFRMRNWLKALVAEAA